jgi:hypothetical protein
MLELTSRVPRWVTNTAYGGEPCSNELSNALADFLRGSGRQFIQILNTNHVLCHIKTAHKNIA